LQYSGKEIYFSSNSGGQTQGLLHVRKALSTSQVLRFGFFTSEKINNLEGGQREVFGFVF
jgi:hypothetical protein